MKQKDCIAKNEGKKKNENEAANNYAKIIIEKLADIEKQIINLPDTPLTLNETAEYLRLSQKHLYRLTYQKKIPFYKPCGKVIYFFKKELEMWIKGGNVKGETEDAACEEIKDPNQIEMELGKFEDRTLRQSSGQESETGDWKRKGKELVIELPMKRKKKKTDFSFQKS